MVKWVNPCAGSDIGVAIELMVYRETFSRPLYFDIYVDGLYLMLLYIGPLCTLVFMNVRLVQAIRYDASRFFLYISPYRTNPLIVANVRRLLIMGVSKSSELRVTGYEVVRR